VTAGTDVAAAAAAAAAAVVARQIAAQVASALNRLHRIVVYLYCRF
jgi:hypothetical protein